MASYNVTHFPKLIGDAIDELNCMYAEEGRFKFWTFNMVHDRWFIFSSYELKPETKEVVNLKWFHVTNVADFKNQWISEYEKDGGDSEYGSIDKWQGFEDVIEQFES